MSAAVLFILISASVASLSRQPYPHQIHSTMPYHTQYIPRRLTMRLDHIRNCRSACHPAPQMSLFRHCISHSFVTVSLASRHLATVSTPYSLAGYCQYQPSAKPNLIRRRQIHSQTLDSRSIAPNALYFAVVSDILPSLYHLRLDTWPLSRHLIRLLTCQYQPSAKLDLIRSAVLDAKLFHNFSLLDLLTPKAPPLNERDASQFLCSVQGSPKAYLPSPAL
jgi:hypothetical protein